MPARYHAILLFLLTCACFRVQHGSAKNYRAHRDQVTNECGHLFITVSSVKQASLEINWDFPCDNPPSAIRLYSNDPTSENPKLILPLKLHTHKGFYATDITLKESLPGGWNLQDNEMTPGPHCLNYWIASYRNNTLVQKKCLRIQPTWMESNGAEIEDIPMGEMFIPGTHNTGCYDTRGRGFNTFNKYVITQDMDAWTQLAFGIRYFDVRIGYYNFTNSQNEFWINHDIFRVAKLIPLLRELKLFLSRATKEVVILDLHRFPVGFKTHEKERHAQLVDILYKELGDVAISKHFQNKRGPTLKEIWKQKKRLIICYGDKRTAESTNWLWEPLTQFWGNQQTREGLKDYLQSVTTEGKSLKNPLWAAMAELTPSPALVIFGMLSSTTSLAHLADEVNKNVTDWYRSDWAKNANIVATDFFLGNDIIDLAIQANLKRAIEDKS